GLACGRELRAVFEGRLAREQALRRYGSFSDTHGWKFGSLLAVQRAVGLVGPTRIVTALTRALESPRVVSWAFDHYLNIAPPSFAAEVRERVPPRPRPSALRPRQALGA